MGVILAIFRSVAQESETKTKKTLSDSKLNNLKIQELKKRLTDEELETLKEKGLEVIQALRKERAKDAYM